MPRSKKKNLISRKVATNFKSFFRYVFPLSFDNWVHGAYVDEIADFLQSNQKTIRVGPRDHVKSTSFYAHFMWNLLRKKYYEGNLECHYFSYKEGMAKYHIGSNRNEDNIKDLVRRNPFFSDVLDEKENAEGTASYTWPTSSTNNRVTITSNGLLTFTRGIHTRGIVYIDDPLQDETPNTKLDPTKVRTINNRIKTTIYNMPQYESGGQLHIVGTPQTEEDFFFEPKFTSKFAVKQSAAIIDEEKKKVLFPEFRPYEWLADKRDTLTEAIWLQEYMVRPTYSTDSFLKDDKLKEVQNTKLVNYTLKHTYKRPKDVDNVGGFDIGKHQHPSHLSIFETDNDGKYKQIHSKWMDKWSYNEQVEYLEDIIEHFKVSALYYDDTRGEFESLQERGNLPDQLVPVKLTGRRKRFDLARALAQKVEKKSIMFIDDQRQYRQMLSVDSDLKARETAEGHGDSFWSNALAMEAENKVEADIIFI